MKTIILKPSLLQTGLITKSYCLLRKLPNDLRHAAISASQKTNDSNNDQQNVFYQDPFSGAQLVRPFDAKIHDGRKSDTKGWETESTEEGDEKAQKWYRNCQDN